MRREDVSLNKGVKLVILREGQEHYMRLLVPKNGTPTFITPKLGLDPFDHQGLQEPTGVYRCYVGNLLILLILVDNERRVVVKLGDFTAWGQRGRLTQALQAIAV